MTLEEAIKHEEEIVEEEQYEYQECVATHNIEGAMNCRKYAEKHRQLAEWLKDYKRLLEQEPKQGYCKDCKHMRYGSHPFGRTIECSKDILLCPNDNVFCSKYERR